MLAGVISRCITPRRCIPATARASSTASPVNSSAGSGFASPARLVPPASSSTIDPGYCRRIRQLDHPSHPAQPLQHRPLMPNPPLPVRPQRLLADHRPPGQEQTADARACALVHNLGPDRWIPARQHPAWPHLPTSARARIYLTTYI